MSFVCLWNPRWPTGVDFPADLVAALLQHAPRIAVGERGLVWADARGLHAPRLAEQLLAVANDYGFDDTRAGVAMTAIAAEVAVLGTRDSGLGFSPLPRVPSTEYRVPIVIKPGTDRAFIAPYPLAVLHPDEPLASLLQGLGIETCGQLAALDAEAIEVRLGVGGVRLWELSRAEDHRWLFTTTLRALPSASLEWVEYGLKDPERLLFVINALAQTICESLSQRGERAREIALVFALGNRTQRTHIVRSGRSSAEQKRWMRLVREALDTITLPDAVTGIALRVESVTGNDGAQGDLFDRGFASAPLVENAIVELTDDQGDVVVVPENSGHPLVEERTKWKSVEVLGTRDSVLGRGRGSRAPRPLTRAPAQYRIPKLRLQLLPTPHLVTVATEQRRDHEIPIRYCDANEWHDLVDVAGPDRVSGGAWSTPYAREYFRCVREDGMMVWLFKGSFESADWFLHGWWD